MRSHAGKLYNRRSIFSSTMGRQTYLLPCMKNTPACREKEMTLSCSDTSSPRQACRLIRPFAAPWSFQCLLPVMRVQPFGQGKAAGCLRSKGFPGYDVCKLLEGQIDDGKGGFRGTLMREQEIAIPARVSREYVARIGVVVQRRRGVSVDFTRSAHDQS